MGAITPPVHRTLQGNSMKRRTFLAIPVLSVAAMLALVSIATVSVATGALPQTAANRPVLLRTRPKLSEIRLEVELFQQASLDGRSGTVTLNGNTPQSTNVNTTPTYQAAGVSLGVPVLVRTSWCDTDFTKYVARATVDGLDAATDPSKIFTRMPGTAEATLKYEVPFPRGAAESLLLRTTYQVQRWELDVDERAAATATWPREWPSGVDRFLKQEAGIDPTIKALQAVAEGATPGGSRSVSPFVAARNTVVAISKGWKFANSGTSIYGQKGALRGINFTDSGIWGIEAGGGTPVELAATCVAGVRSLGIPSRVVYCLTQRGRARDRDSKGAAAEFRFVCEFFLPNIGWIPFDPMIVRQNAATTQATGMVKGFANVEDLVTTLPLAFRTVADGYEKADRYALWGWKGNVTVNADRAVSRIGFDASGRGNGKIPQMPAPVSDETP